MSVLLVRLSHPPGGEHLAVHGFTVDRTDEGWAEVQQAECLLPRDHELFEHARSAVLSTTLDPRLRPDAAGLALWELIAGGEVGDWWRQVTDSTAERTVRTVLDVVPEELQSVPWELMAPAGRAPVFRNERHPWTRARTPWQSLEAIPPPISVLVVVGDTDPTLEADDEIAAVHEALRGAPGRWNVDVLQNPDLRTLRSKVEEIQPEVLHLIAHGVDWRSERVLRMVDAAGRPWRLHAKDVDELPTPAARLVVLNACRSEHAPDGQQSASTFAAAFLRSGAAAVVAMQGDVRSDAAAEFSRTFYAGLADGRAVDVATALARRAVHDLLRVEDPDDERNWAMPLLQVAADPDRILPVRVSLRDEERIRQAQLAEAFEGVGRTIDRSHERRQFWRAVTPAADGTAPSPGPVVVSGEAASGKSAMVLSALMTLRLRGLNVVYVDLTRRGLDARPASWLTVLRRIRDAVWYWVPETPVAPRQRWDHDLWYLRRYREPLPWSADAMRSDDGEEFPSVGDQYHDTIREIFRRFQRMLREAGAEERLLVVLDGMAGAYLGDLREWLGPLLLDPASQQVPLPVSWAVVGTEQQLAWLPSAPVPQQRITVGPFRRDEMTRLAREHFARQGLTVRGTAWWSAIQGVIDGAPESGWTAGQFRHVLDLRLLLDGEAS